MFLSAASFGADVSSSKTFLNGIHQMLPWIGRFVGDRKYSQSVQTTLRQIVPLDEPN